MPLPEWLESSFVVAALTGLLVILGQALIAFYQRRKTDAEAAKAQSEAHKAEAEARKAEAEVSRTSAEQISDVWSMVDKLTERVKTVEAERTREAAASHAVSLEVTELKRQQGINIATIAALNSQNATTLKMNNELLLENRLLHDRVNQLESELSNERQANAVMQQKIKTLEARVAELEARSPAQ